MSGLTITKLTVMRGKNQLHYDLAYTFTNPGSMYGLLGPNGVGKTTLLHSLAGLIKPIAGSIDLHGEAIARIPTKQRAQRIGILLQEQRQLFAQTVFEYCLTSRYPYSHYFASYTKHDIKLINEALAIVGLSSYLHKPITQLSSGEYKRLAIAALLTQDPDIYLLDEPINHLDNHFQIEILKHLVYLTNTKQKIIIISLHDINLAAQFCKTILLMFPDGKIQHGVPNDILCQATLSKLYNHPITKQMAWLAMS